MAAHLLVRVNVRASDGCVVEDAFLRPTCLSSGTKAGIGALSFFGMEVSPWHLRTRLGRSVGCSRHGIMRFSTLNSGKASIVESIREKRSNAAT